MTNLPIRIQKENEKDLDNEYRNYIFSKLVFKLIHTKTYNKVLKHRKNCPKWGKSLCLECFGGGLTKFTSDLLDEVKK